MSDQYIGEIRMFAGAYAPEGWHFCDGSLLSGKEYPALLAVLGTAYGGDVQQFALPDLRGRVPIHQGQAPGMTDRKIGQAGGAEFVVLDVTNMPAHTHQFFATNEGATSDSPAALQPGTTPETETGRGMFSTDANAKLVSMAANSLEVAFGGAQGHVAPHNNMMPSRAINFIIALEGYFPTKE